MKTTSAHALLGKLLFYVVLPFLHIFPQRSARLRAIIVNEHNEVLLVRNWFSHQQWELPGGGKKRNESDEEGLLRELQEELSFQTTKEELHYLAHWTTNERIAPLRLTGFAVQTTTFQPKLRHELLQAKWHRIDRLPNDPQGYFSTAVGKYLNNAG